MKLTLALVLSFAVSTLAQVKNTTTTTTTSSYPGVNSCGWCIQQGGKWNVTAAVCATTGPIVDLTGCTQ